MSKGNKDEERYGKRYERKIINEVRICERGREREREV